MKASEKVKTKPFCFGLLKEIATFVLETCIMG